MSLLMKSLSQSFECLHGGNRCKIDYLFGKSKGQKWCYRKLFKELSISHKTSVESW